MLIAHFYKKGDKKKDPKVYEQYKRMEYLFKDASRGYADLVYFIRVPIRKKKELQKLAESYQIESNNGFVLFSGREKIANNGKIKGVEGFMNCRFSEKSYKKRTGSESF